MLPHEKPPQLFLYVRPYCFQCASRWSYETLSLRQKGVCTPVPQVRKLRLREEKQPAQVVAGRRQDHTLDTCSCPERLAPDQGPSSPS